MSAFTSAILVAVLASVAFAATDDGVVNCTAVPKTINTALYMPSAECIAAVPAYAACDRITNCLNETNTCSRFYSCFRAKLTCIAAVSTNASACADFQQTLSNFELYISAGGVYNGSALQTSCERTLCADVAALSFSCDANATEACAAPVAFTPVNRSADETLYTLTLAGDFTDALANKKTELEAATVRGVAKVTQVDESNLGFVSIGAGSLVIEFVVNDATVAVSTITARLQAAIGEASFWEELSAVVGFTVTASSFNVNTPAGPAPADDNKKSCGAGCIAGIVIGAVVVVAIIGFCVVRKGSKGSSQESEPIAGAELRTARN